MGDGEAISLVGAGESEVPRTVAGISLTGLLGGPIGKKDDEDSQEPEEISQDAVFLLGVKLRKHREEVLLLLLDGRCRGLLFFLFLF